MDANNVIHRICMFLFGILLICAVMIGVTYYQLQELKDATHLGKTKGSNNKKRDIELRLEEMMRKMEKDD